MSATLSYYIGAPKVEQEELAFVLQFVNDSLEEDRGKDSVTRPSPSFGERGDTRRARAPVRDG